MNDLLPIVSSNKKKRHDKPTPANSWLVTVDPQEWVNKYSDYLNNYALSKLNDKEQAKDIVQETFLAALENLDKFENRSSERTWLTAILKYKVSLIYRKRLKNVIVLTNFYNDPALENIRDIDSTLRLRPNYFINQDPLVNKELDFCLRQFILKLPELWRSLYIMKYIEEENRDKICAQLKISLSYYWVICHRLKEGLKSHFKNNWF